VRYGILIIPPGVARCGNVYCGNVYCGNVYSGGCWWQRTGNVWRSRICGGHPVNDLGGHLVTVGTRWLNFWLCVLAFHFTLTVYRVVYNKVANKKTGIEDRVRCLHIWRFCL
jgi:hypothetical protein